MPPKRQGSWQDDQFGPHYHAQQQSSRSSSGGASQHEHVPEPFYNYDEPLRHESSFHQNTAHQYQNYGRRDEPLPPAMLLAQPSDRNYLPEEEYVLCCNIEMFAASASDVQEAGYGDRAATTVGQLGLRCIHCWRSPLATAAYGTLFPGSINSMNASLDLMAEEHFPKCMRIPPEIRDIIGRKKRKRRSEDEEDDALLQFCCHTLPRRCNINNMYPFKSGVRYSSSNLDSGRIEHSSWGGTNNQIYSSDERKQSSYPQSSHPETPGRANLSSSSRNHPRRNSDPCTQGSASSANLRNEAQHPPHLTYQPPPPPQSTSPRSSYSQPYHPQFPMEGGYPTHNQHYHQHHRYDISQAFVRDAMGGWVCRHCLHIPYQFRAPNSYSQSPSPPSIQFIEHHLGMCRGNMYMPPPPPHMGWQPHHMMGVPHMPLHPPEDHPNHPQNPNPASNSAMTAALNYLKNNVTPHTTSALVFSDDKTLLTDYFFHLMQQLQLCRFSESDRKTRGGKRENVKIGFGGIECKHCANVVGNTLSRKFFWSNVDRLANSFAEIPSHVLKCRNCPGEVKSALSQLKLRHPEQMAQLPRGSQKVYFRRMWRRMHSHPDEVSSDQEEGNNVGSGPRPIPTNGTGVPLAIPEDHDWLSDMDCFVRKNLEVFCAQEDDIMSAQSDRKYPIQSGQVGIRCKHCAAQGAARGNAVSFPYSISGIYESVREFQRLHLESCPQLSEDLRKEMSQLKTSTSLSSVLRRYYVLAAKALGMMDTQDGIRAGGEIIPINSVAEIINNDANINVSNSSNQRADDDGGDNKRIRLE